MKGAMTVRQASITRNTNETKITAALTLEGKGTAEISTGCGFLDHMLELFARHGRFDLTLTCDGDLQVDAHHTQEADAPKGIQLPKTSYHQFRAALASSSSTR